MVEILSCPPSWLHPNWGKGPCAPAGSSRVVVQAPKRKQLDLLHSAIAPGSSILSSYNSIIGRADIIMISTFPNDSAVFVDVCKPGCWSAMWEGAGSLSYGGHDWTPEDRHSFVTLEHLVPLTQEPHTFRSSITTFERKIAHMEEETNILQKLEMIYISYPAHALDRDTSENQVGLFHFLTFETRRMRPKDVAYFVSDNTK